MGTKMKKLILIMIVSWCTVVNISWLHANDLKDVDFEKQREIYESLLKDYGFSYCINTYVQDIVLSINSGYASGSYFQKGGHIEPAYSNIRKFIRDKISNNHLYYTGNQKANLLGCLNICYSKEYQDFIINQRVNLPSVDDNF